MTRVLIAVDHSQEASEAAQQAHRLFGDDATYLVVNVLDHGDGSRQAWGHVFPVPTPFGSFPLLTTGPVAALDEPSTRALAAGTAAEVAEEASLGTVETIGLAGDPSTTILKAAYDNDADVIVIGSHQRSWFSRLFDPSVAEQVIKLASIPVLVVK